ncbi:hypothetical protein JCM10212_000927 [Sporobolomyces blumeae]
MLRLKSSAGAALPRACRCPSTSTALPCVHARPHSSSASRSRPSSLAHSTRPSHDHSHHRDQSTSWSYSPVSDHASRHWFGPVKPGWNGWVDADRESLEGSPRATVMSKSRPPLYDTRSSTRTKELSMLDARSKRPKPPPPAKLHAQPLDDATMTRLDSYLLNRGSRTALSHFSDEYGQLLTIAKERHLPFLEAAVKEDLELSKMSVKERERVDEDRFSSGTLKKDEGKGKGIETKGLREIVDVIRESEPEAETKRRRTEIGQAVVADEVRDDTEIVIDDGTMSLQAAVDAIRHTSTSASRNVHLASSLSPDRLATAWETFVGAADLVHSIEDYTLTLSLLHYLSTPASPSSSPPDLPLALKVFTALLECLPEELVATQPDRSSLPSDVALQVVLLRTVVNASLSENLYELALRGLESLDTIRSRYGELDEGRNVELDLASETLSPMLSDLAEERSKAYKPSNLPSAYSTPGSTLSLCRSVLTLVAKWLPRTTDDGVARLDSRLSTAISSFATEAAERYRWDVVASVWAEWEGRGWTLEKGHVKLARWLAGEAPFSTYGPRLKRASTTNAARSTRIVQPELFARLAERTHAQLRHAGSGLAATWSTTDKYDWIDLLTTSPAASRSTRSLARRITAHWMSIAPLSSRDPFLLRGPTLLALVRTSLPPYAPSATLHCPFLRTLLNTVIQALVNPSSPFSASSPSELLHFDLTTLAQAYTLLGDHASVAQVYRKMLAQKQLPDHKDVQVVLGAGPRRHAESAIALVRHAHKVGIKIRLETVEMVLKSLMEGEVELRKLEVEPVGTIDRGLVERQRGRMEAKYFDVLRLARDVGFASNEILRLERTYEDYLPFASPAQVARYSPDRLARLLEKGTTTINPSIAFALVDKARASRNPLLAVRLLRHCCAPASSLSTPSDRSTTTPRLSSPRLFAAVVDTLLHCLARGSSSTRASIRVFLQEVIDLGLSTDPSWIASNRDGLNSTLKALVKVGEVDAVERMWEVLEGEHGQGALVQPKQEVKETVVRWAVGLEGRERASGREGIVGVWARETLNPNRDSASDSSSELIANQVADGE